MPAEPASGVIIWPVSDPEITDEARPHAKHTEGFGRQLTDSKLLAALDVTPGGAPVAKIALILSYIGLGAASWLLCYGPAEATDGTMLPAATAAALGAGIVALVLFYARRRDAVGDERGNVALITAFMIFILAASAGFAIDFTRASNARNRLQDALDAATLAGARSTDTSVVVTAAKAHLKSHTDSMADLAGVNATFQVNGDELIGFAEGDVMPIFVGFPPGKAMHVATQAKVKRGIVGSLEVALVLDTTFSMTGASGSTTKLALLKVAAKDLVQKITKNPAANVKMAVVPFAQYVNIGPTRRIEPWINVGANYTTGSAQQCTTTYDATIQSESVCSAYQQNTCTGTKDGTSYTYACNGACKTWTTKSYAPLGKPKTTCTGGYTNYKFFGCVGSPPYPKNVQDQDPSRVYPGLLETGSSCGSEITVLTADKTKVTGAIDALTAVGETYIPSGMAWGLNALSPQKPLTEGAAFDPEGHNRKPRKVIVLMTDGANTKYLQPNSTPAGMHNGNSAAAGKPATQSDDFTAELCSSAKSVGIEIFTIAFQVPNNSAKTMLQGCATDTSHYFDAGDSAKLLSAFSAIADSLQSIYISS